jgi:trehalose 6-phosphate phosphatase
MKHALAGGGREALVQALRRPFVVGLDFDGTLAPIVADPRAVAVPEAIRAAVDHLAQRVPTAIISGRELADVRARMRLHRVTYYGNHGLEGGPGWPGPADEYRRLTARWHSRLERTIGSDLARLSISIENKSFSLAVHFRRSRDREAAAESIRRAIAALDPSPRLVPGKAVVNLVPAHAPTKGDALALFAAAHDARCALFVGDDETDEDAFDVAGLAVVGVRIGPSRGSRAGFCLRGQPEVLALLELIGGGIREEVRLAVEDR